MPLPISRLRLNALLFSSELSISAMDIKIQSEIFSSNSLSLSELLGLFKI